MCKSCDGSLWPLPPAVVFSCSSALYRNCLLCSSVYFPMHLKLLAVAGVRNLEDLPDELLLSLCQYCHERDLCRLAQVSKRLNRISSDKTLWWVIVPCLLAYSYPSRGTMSACCPRRRLFNAVFEMPVAFDIELQSSKSAMSLPPSPTVPSRISPIDSDCSIRSLSSPMAGPAVDWKSHFRTMVCHLFAY